MLNVSAISNYTTTGRSNSFDISELNTSPRGRPLKHATKASSISTAYDIKSATGIPFKEDLHSKLAFTNAEVERLTYVNSELMAEIEDWKKHFREAEKLIGKNVSLTINKVDDQVNLRCRELEQQVTDLSTRYINMEQSYLKEIENLKSRLNVAVFESNHKRQRTEMTPKAKGDLSIRTPRFAKDLRPGVSESSPFQQHQTVPFPLHLSHIEEKLPSENFDESCEMTEPIYMKALIFEGSPSKSDRRFELSIVEAIKGDDAISFDQSFTEEKLSESFNRLNRSLEIAETCIDKLPLKCASKLNEGECCQNRRIELEKLKEEIKKLRRDLSGYEVVATVLSKKAQEAVQLKKEKESMEQELKDYKQKLLENEKRTMQPTSQEVFNVQDYEYRSRVFNESPRKVLEINKQIELLNEKESLISQLNEARNVIKSASEKEEKLQSEINRLSQVVEENKWALRVCEQDKSQLQGRIVELEKTVQTLNVEIGIWKEKYEQLDCRTKQSRGESDSLASDLKIRFEQNEQKVVELQKENYSLNGVIILKTLELDELRRSQKVIMDGQKEDMNKKWQKSCEQMEEIALSLESRKNNMQAQLERMQAIVGTNMQEMEKLDEQNEAIKQENQFLLEEIKALKAREEQYQNLLHGLKERL